MAATNKVREQLAQEFLNALNQGYIPWQACWSQQRPLNAVTGKIYRGVNAIALSYTADDCGYADPRWCTYRQAQEKGWQVRKGEKSASVEYWAYYDLKEKKLLSWQDVKEKLKADPDYEKNLQLRCRVYNVFNAQQIDGIPELEQNHTDIGSLRLHRDTLIQNMGIQYQEAGVEAYYSPSRDKVVLPPENSFDSTYSYMATFLHECGHATGHTSRLNRDLAGTFGSESYAREELRAEIASAFTAQSLGLQLTDQQLAYQTKQHAAYVQHWAAILKDAPDELFRAIKAAEGISDYLIEKGEFDMMMETPKPNLEEWSVVYDSSDPLVGTLVIVPAADVDGRDVLETYQCAGVQEAAEKLQRYEELQSYFWDETNDPETQEWRDELTTNEAAMVARWDEQLAHGTESLLADVLGPTEEVKDQMLSNILEKLPPRYALEEIPEIPGGLRLCFHGHGKIEGYSAPDARPWQPQIDRIREIVIDDGITEIDRDVLNGYPAVEKVIWPRSITRAPFSLWNCPNLKEVTFSGIPQQNAGALDTASPWEIAELAGHYPDLTREQLSEIAAGFRDGHSWREISVYAKPEFSSLQMGAIRYALASDLTPEQIDLIADPRFTPVQMDILRCCFLTGMNTKQVQHFADTELPGYQVLSDTVPEPAPPAEGPIMAMGG